MKHPHYDMIVAKAANMELVVLTKQGVNIDWEFYQLQYSTEMLTHHKYFLCLPQHKDACLHWLNGGNAQTFHGVWQNINSYDTAIPFNQWDGWLDKTMVFRIKPTMVKRWIAINKDNGQLFKNSADTKEDLECMIPTFSIDNLPYKPFQLIEIEVQQ